MGHMQERESYLLHVLRHVKVDSGLVLLFLKTFNSVWDNECNSFVYPTGMANYIGVGGHQVVDN